MHFVVFVYFGSIQSFFGNVCNFLHSHYLCISHLNSILTEVDLMTVLGFCQSPTLTLELMCLHRQKSTCMELKTGKIQTANEK